MDLIDRYTRSKPISAAHVESEIVRITEDMEKETEALSCLPLTMLKKKHSIRKSGLKNF
jgi:hypothetical protein